MSPGRWQGFDAKLRSYLGPLVTFILLLTLEVVGVLSSYEQVPHDRGLLLLSRQQRLLTVIELAAHQALSPSAGDAVAARDRLLEASSDLAEDFATLQRPSPDGVDATIRARLASQAPDRARFLQAVASFAARPSQASLKELSEEAVPLERLSAKAVDLCRRNREAKLATCRTSALLINVGGAVLLLAAGGLMAQRQFSELRQALTRATFTNESLTKEVNRVLEIQCQLETLGVQNKEYKEELARAVEEAEHSNEILRRATHRFQELVSGLPIPCLATDTSGVIYEWNRAASDVLGHPSESVYLRNALEVLPEPASQGTLEWVFNQVSRGEPVPEFEWTAVKLDGEPVELLAMAFPHRGPDGAVLGAIITCVDHTQRKKFERLLQDQLATIQEMNKRLETANSRLEALAATDGLTGLFNHRAFQQSLSEAVSSVWRNEPLSLVLLDIDHFKEYNDRFGHLAGDEALRKVASVLEACLQEGKTVARYGGEEFAILCPGCSVESAVELSERLRKEIAALSMPGRSVTASFGVAGWTRGLHGPSDLTGQADIALYESKRLGRNRVTAFAAKSEKAA